MLFDDDDRAHAINQLAGKSWEELEVIEAQGELLFPEKIACRRKDGKFEEIPVLLKVLREPELRKARVQAKQWAKEEGIDIEADASFFEDMQATCELWLAIRNPKPGKAPDGTTYHEPLYGSPQEVEKKFDKSVLRQVIGKLEGYARSLDPALENLTEHEVITLTAAIVKERSIRPLLGCAPRLQSAYIVFLASMHLLSLQQSFSSESSDSSIAEQ